MSQCLVVKTGSVSCKFACHLTRLTNKKFDLIVGLFTKCEAPIMNEEKLRQSNKTHKLDFLFIPGSYTFRCLDLFFIPVNLGWENRFETDNSLLSLSNLLFSFLGGFL